MNNVLTPQVTIYSTSWCAFCHAEIQWLNKMGIPYISKDIETDKEAYLELMGKNGGTFSGVPVTDIAGNLILGFDRPKLEEAIRTHNIRPVIA